MNQILRYIETHDVVASNTKDFNVGGQNELHNLCSHVCSSQNKERKHLEKICLEFVMQVYRNITYKMDIEAKNYPQKWTYLDLSFKHDVILG